MNRASRLAGQLVVLAARLPLCSAVELATLARAHPGSVRRELRRLVDDGLLVGEQRGVASVSRGSRYRVTTAGRAWAGELVGSHEPTTTPPFGNTPLELTALRNRIDWISAARAVFLRLLEACDDVGRGKVWLDGWEVPARAGAKHLDGLGVLVVDDRRWLVAVVLDRARIPADRLLPLMRSAGAALTARGDGFLIGAGPDRQRLAWVLDRVRNDHGLANVQFVELTSAQSVHEFVAALSRNVGPRPRARTIPLGGDGRSGTLRARCAQTERRLATTAARLVPADITMLHELADHAPATAAGLAFTGRSSRPAARQRLRRLATAGLAVAVSDGRPRRYAITAQGVGLLAARDGWPSAGAYARARGIWFVGADGRGLPGLRKLIAHNAGTDAFIRLLDRAATDMRAQGRDDRLVTWEGPGACHRRFAHDGALRHLRPDAFGVYRRAGLEHPFHLEWDRGTMRSWQYRRKLEAYRAYVDAQWWRVDRADLPSVLFVFRHWQTEHQVLHLAAEEFADLHELVMLATTVWRLKRYGPLAAIWRDPFDERRTPWPPSLTAACEPLTPRSPRSAFAGGAGRLGRRDSVVEGQHEYRRK